MMVEGDVFVLEGFDAYHFQIFLELLRIAAKIIVVSEAKPCAERCCACPRQRVKIGSSFANMAGNDVAGYDDHVGPRLHKAVDYSPKGLWF